MSSITFDGVRFSLYSDDHPPPHVHGHYADIEVVIEIHPDFVCLARRKRNIKPANAKAADVAYIESTAAKYKNELLALWEKINVASGR